MTLQEEIKQDVIDELQFDSRVDASNIKVTVDGNEVTLEGTVPTYLSKESAETDVWALEGVLSINNNIEVKYKTPPALPTDEDLQERIENKFLWNADIGSEKINVEVDDLHVTLSGEVEDYWESLEAEMEALNIRGVLGVTNEIVVVPTETLSDELIAEGIMEKIRRNIAINPDQVTVKVEDGKVTLTGSVDTWIARTAARDAASHTSGVVEIDNQILIATQ